MAAKFSVGDHVKVDHPTAGQWQGSVVRRNLTDIVDGQEQWEYEVTNAPTKHAYQSEFPLLAWESEMEAVQQKTNRQRLLEVMDRQE